MEEAWMIFADYSQSFEFGFPTVGSLSQKMENFDMYGEFKSDF